MPKIQKLKFNVMAFLDLGGIVAKPGVFSVSFLCRVVQSSTRMPVTPDFNKGCPRSGSWVYQEACVGHQRHTHTRRTPLYCPSPTDDRQCHIYRQSDIERTAQLLLRPLRRAGPLATASRMTGPKIDGRSSSPSRLLGRCFARGRISRRSSPDCPFRRLLQTIRLSLQTVVSRLTLQGQPPPFIEPNSP